MGLANLVDWNNEATIGTPAVDVVRILWLQKRDYFLEAWETYRKNRINNIKQGVNICRARLETLFNEMQATLKQRLPPEEFESMKKAVLDPADDSEIIGIFYRINEEMHKIRLIKLDNKKDIDITSVEDDNLDMGL